ncbi:MAG: substrate-binding domain-containing protein [Anaerolineae bacterium]|nr:substrate-binding domain-containing protein [Anaerolineae bacterium]
MSAYRRWWLVAGVLLLIWGGISAATGCQPVEVVSTKARQVIVLYGFSTVEEVFNDEIFPLFRSHWLAQSGQEVTFQGVFTSSEQLSDAVIGGAPADVVILPNEWYAVWLSINGVLDEHWRALPNEGVVTRSPVVIVVRPGNPLGIKDWSDLTRPEVKLIHPDPRTSGGAQWALLAEFGAAALAEHSTPQAGYEQVRRIWANVIATPPSIREGMRVFLFGTGNALVTYEQDALLAKARGASLEIVIPPRTVVSEHVAAVVEHNVKPWEREGVNAFMDFLWSEQAQRAFTRYYFRSATDETLNDPAAGFGALAQPFTADALGGWGEAYPEIIQWTIEELLQGR